MPSFRAVLLTLALTVSLLALPPVVQAESRTIHFRGEAVKVPAGWPVIRLAERSRACVRLDRRAVYLGSPGPNQRCPVGAMGRRRAILIDPGAVPLTGEFHPNSGRNSPARPLRRAARPSAILPRQRSATPPFLTAASGYTGLGFDACAAPSSRTMAAWATSPYRAVGVYIGGLNRACVQPNLTTTWVAEQVAEGWSLIPTYVGLQAPTSACADCAKLSSALAAGQGAAAANDAVTDAQAVGMGAGSPIYFDMEAYTQTASATRATLTFLAAWTEELHALGYVSGVYSSSASGIADLADQVGSDYPVPDDLWIANWNGRQDTLDPNVSPDAWLGHRIHQYRGGHDETWGGVTINVDNDYVEGTTYGTATAPPPLPPLTVRNVRPEGGTVRLWVRCGWPAEQSCPGRILLRTQAKLPLEAKPGVRTRIARIAISRRLFRLGGGRSHTFRVRLDSRGRPLLLRRGLLRAQLFVAIPGARITRAVRLRPAR